MSKAWMITAILLAIWTIPWKGLALWKSAKRGDKAWFIILLLINTLAVLEILYLFVFSKEKKEEPKITQFRNPKQFV
jgi:methionyl-tRNA synthetase